MAEYNSLQLFFFLAITLGAGCLTEIKSKGDSDCVDERGRDFADDGGDDGEGDGGDYGNREDADGR